MKNCYGYALAFLCCAGAASAETTMWRLPEAVLVTDAPLQPVGGLPGFRSRSYRQLLAGRATPLVDRLFGDQVTGSTSAHRHSYRAEMEGVSVSAEALRLQPAVADRWTGHTDSGALRKSWAVGIGSQLPLDTGDQLSVGLVTGTYRARSPTGILSDPRDSSSLRLVDLSWAHGDRWRFGMGWRQAGGGARSPLDRLVAISNGALLHEHGLRLTVGFLPNGGSDPHQSSVGVEVRRASISLGDLAALGQAPQFNAQGKVYFRSHF